MIRINNIKLKIEHSEKELFNAICCKLHLKGNEIKDYRIIKQSIDARKNENLQYIYSVNVNLINEQKYRLNRRNNDISVVTEIKYKEPETDGLKPEQLNGRIIIVGSGPAGLFCSLKLAEAGFRPLVLERGGCVEERIAEVNSFWESGRLNPNTNVQFGEGGAGTFSDGKLNTMVHDREGRIVEVFRIFVEHGAPESIKYINKPHIGTDRLTHIVKSIRERILELGGTVRFNTCLTDIHTENGAVRSITVNNNEVLDCDYLILATGHSARDTFKMLHAKGISMEKKAFAVGVRVEHSQKLISMNQYGNEYHKLPPADYKLTYHCKHSDRGVYSFCMCPGGYVVNASSEEGMLAINGMSNSDRGGRNANSAIVVTVTPDDFSGDSVLAGIEFQRRLERKAYEAGNGCIPVERFGDFRRNRDGEDIQARINDDFELSPDTKGRYLYADVRGILPEFVAEAIEEGMYAFDRKIKGFASDSAVLSAIETRTSSPVRIIRDELMQSPDIRGLYPCGEGAGYAGGITSAAVDGIRIYEAVIRSMKLQNN